MGLRISRLVEGISSRSTGSQALQPQARKGKDIRVIAGSPNHKSSSLELDTVMRFEEWVGVDRPDHKPSSLEHNKAMRFEESIGINRLDH